MLATSNKGKVREISEILNGFDVRPLQDFLEPFTIVEDGASFKENALIKAETVYRRLNRTDVMVLADDSGISVPVLQNEPGIYSARYAGEGASDRDNLDLLIAKLKEKQLKRTEAFYSCAIALVGRFGIHTSHGFMYGHVLDEAVGDKGFGYDPMFVPKGYSKTLGQIGDSFKNTFSHRGKALRPMKRLLEYFSANHVKQ